MPLFQKPVYYPPTVMDREAGQVLSIRVRTRTPPGGGARGQFLEPGSTAGMRVRNGASIQGGSFGPSNNQNFQGS
jgi:hypothetical protein